MESDPEDRVSQQAAEQGLPEGFVEEVFKAIHQASIAAQRFGLK